MHRALCPAWVALTTSSFLWGGEGDAPEEEQAEQGNGLCWYNSTLVVSSLCSLSAEVVISLWGFMDDSEIFRSLRD